MSYIFLVIITYFIDMAAGTVLYDHWYSCHFLMVDIYMGWWLTPHTLLLSQTFIFYSLSSFLLFFFSYLITKC
uniref:Uncharacterized protein n=1 Tax=Nelumbo nucifera TaxID=4432 RepID=A0A822YTF2_NELNU|nr:TPA_asm: hypothetical protein HUJ06_006420 [Nelumbo nucifera]